MYATCIFCHSSLGANDAIEHFPVGKRLAFDEAKGRLWVVCPKCDRWNLSPIEERWEAIEEAERSYRDTKKRVATENIGLAQMPDKTVLIRIGAPLRPEFAGWRYGEIFKRRRSKAMTAAVLFGVTYFAIDKLTTGSLGLAFGGSLAVQSAFAVGAGMLQVRNRQAHIRDQSDTLRTLANGEAMTTRYAFDPHRGSLSLNMTSRHGEQHSSTFSRWPERMRALSRFAYDKDHTIELTGDVARRALANMLPIVNGNGGSAAQVSEATGLVERNNEFTQLMRLAPGNAQPDFWRSGSPKLILSAMDPTLRLALEMCLHEDDERRALEGELHELEQRWKDADEIAAIADSLTLPAGTDERVRKLRADNE